MDKKLKKLKKQIKHLKQGEEIKIDELEILCIDDNNLMVFNGSDIEEKSKDEFMRLFDD